MTLRRRHLSLAALAALTLGTTSALSPACAATRKKAMAKKKAGKPASPASPAAYGERADLMRYADEHATALGYAPAALRALLALAKPQAAVQRLILPGPPGQAKDWGAYRARFIEPRRLQAGLAFWSEQEAALAAAQARFGVPASLIAAIIGVETFYGRIMGGFRVLDALCTLSFDYPNPLPPGARNRSAYFREELGQFLILARENGLDPLTLKGSYAGAMGWGQFMPGSWRRHALDFDGDGHIDLINSPVDAIGSVANFMRRHGWEPGLPTHFEVDVPSDTAAKAQLLLSDVLPQLDARQFAAAGARLGTPADGFAGPLALVELQMGTAAPVYVAGTRNFYAVTRYNQSSYYAMAVIEFAATLASWRQATQGSQASPLSSASPASASVGGSSQ